MKSEWKQCYLGDLVTFQRGYDLPKAKMKHGDYPVIGSNGIIGWHNEYTTENPGITIGRSGNVGNPFLVKAQSWSHNTTLYIKEFKNVDPLFIYYFLKTLNLANYAGGSAVPTLNRNHIHSLPVFVPVSIEKQQKIVAILSILDDKIELNQKINENLERQAQAVYQLWCSSCPDTVRIGDIADNILDYTPNQLPNVILINSGDVTKGHFEHHTFSENINLKGHFKKRFQKYDILYSEIRPKNKHYAYVLFDAGQYIASTRLMVIRVKKERITPSLLYQHLSSTRVCDEFAATTETRSGTFPQGCFADFASIKIPYRPLDEQSDITAFLDTTYNIIQHNDNESRKLTIIRDTLLPRLMSGEISISDIKLGENG